MVKGKNGYGGELGHVLIPYQGIAGIDGMNPQCNCGQILPYYLPRYPGHELAELDPHRAANVVRDLADQGDPMCKEIFRVQAHALGLFFDEMVNTFDPDALIVGGGALETSPEFQRWFLAEIRGGMPAQREEQVPIHEMLNDDTAGAPGAVAKKALTT